MASECMHDLPPKSTVHSVSDTDTIPSLLSSYIVRRTKGDSNIARKGVRGLRFFQPYHSMEHFINPLWLTVECLDRSNLPSPTLPFQKPSSIGVGRNLMTWSKPSLSFVEWAFLAYYYYYYCMRAIASNHRSFYPSSSIIIKVIMLVYKGIATRARFWNL
jgi:hypothetical protein